MAATYLFRMLPIAKLLLIFLFGSIVSTNISAWQTKTDSTAEISGRLVAFERNARGDLSEVYRNDSEQVFLRVTLAPGFIKFSPSNCPTLQIDRRVPVHHYEAGPVCVLSTDSVNILIATIENNLAVSLPLHRLMNGSQLAVRFVTASGEYRESAFTLRNSKQALQAALGDEIRVDPNTTSAGLDSAHAAAPSEPVSR